MSARSASSKVSLLNQQLERLERGIDGEVQPNNAPPLIIQVPVLRRSPSYQIIGERTSELCAFTSE